MSNKTINIISEIVLPAVTAVLTIVLFFMFRPEDSTGLFWFNLVYTVLLEGIFFGYIIALNRKSEIVSVPFKAVFGIYAFYYIIAGLVWMLLYSLLLARLGVSIKVDIAVTIILTLLWIILSLVTAQADSGYHAGMQEFEDSKKLLNFKIEKMKLLATRYARLCEEKGIVYETESNNRTVVDRLSAKISGLAPGVLKKEVAASQLNTIMDKCESLVDEAEDAPDENLPEINKRIQRFVDNSLAEIELLKS